MNVITLGSFDVLHPGHLHLFRWCRRLAGDGYVIATVNADDFIESYKGHPPVMDEQARRQMVQALPEVDYAAVHTGGGDASKSIEGPWMCGQVTPNLIAIGADWRDRDYLAQLGVTQQWLDDRGIVVVYVPLLAGHSSTGLRERMA